MILLGSLEEWLQRRSILRKSDDLIQEPIPVRLVEVTDSAAGRQNLLNTSGEITEVNSATIDADTGQIKLDLSYLLYGSADTFRASGVSASPTSSEGWIDIAPVQTIQAGGAVPDASYAPATASVLNDAKFYISFYSAAGGVFQLAIEQDHAGTPAALEPDWGAVSLTLPAGVTNLGPFRMNCTADNKSIGLDGSASSFPANDDSITVWGMYRKI